MVACKIAWNDISQKSENKYPQTTTYGNNKYIIEPNKQKQKELIEEGKEQEAKDVYIESVKKYKSLISAKVNESSLSANEVILIVNSDNIPDSLDILKNLR